METNQPANTFKSLACAKEGAGVRDTVVTKQSYEEVAHLHIHV